MQRVIRIGFFLVMIGTLLMLPGPSKGQTAPRGTRSSEMPRITQPVTFDTPEADALLSALEVFPADNPWNEIVADWPVHPDSARMVASIGADKPLRCNTDMGFVLVPPDQERIAVEIVG